MILIKIIYGDAAAADDDDDEGKNDRHLAEFEINEEQNISWINTKPQTPRERKASNVDSVI